MNRESIHPAIPFLVACLGIAAFAAMDVMMKGLSIAMGAYNAMLWRTGIALVIAAALFLLRGNSLPARQVMKIHVWRGLVTSLMAFLFFWGLVHVPIADAIALTFIAPLVALYLSAALLKEHVGGKAVTASIIGFLGGLIVIQGKLSGDYGAETYRGIAAILLSAVMYAYNLILQRQQALVARPLEIALFQNATVVTVYLLFAPFFALVPGSGQLPELAGAAILGIVSMMLLSWAYGRAETKVLIPVEYTAFAWAALMGWMVFGEKVTTSTLAGTALIVVGCLLATWTGSAPAEHVETTAV